MEQRRIEKKRPLIRRNEPYSTKKPGKKTGGKGIKMKKDSETSQKTKKQ